MSSIDFAETRASTLTVKTALIIMFAVTLWRVVMLYFNATDLFVDEAQYWLWGQNLDFGYYSKPPMIAWVIRLFDALSGSNDTFWVRLSAPLFHLGSGLVLMLATRRLLGAETAPWVGVTFVTLPAVSLSSVLVSTDTVQIFFISIALWAFFGLNAKRSVAEAVVLGLSLGLAFMTKYSVLFLLPGALVAMATLPSARVAWRDVFIAAIVGAIVIAPNLWWNLTHGAATVRHTQAIAHWGDDKASPFNPLGALSFFGAQFGVVGPLVFLAMLFAVTRMIRGQCSREEKLLIWLSVPVVLLITLQALFAKAYANWAVAAYAAGTILAVSELKRLRRGLLNSLIINGIVAVVIPLLTVFATDLKLPNGELVMKRYMGRSAVSLDIARIAGEAGTGIVVAEDRDILGDLFYTLRDKPLRIYARDLGGFPTSYYEQRFPFPAATTAENVLFVATEPLTCVDGTSEALKTWQPDFGYKRGRTLYAYRVSPHCLAPPASN